MIPVSQVVPFVEVKMIVRSGVWRSGWIVVRNKQSFAIAFHSGAAEIVDELTFQVTRLPGILRGKKAKKQQYGDWFSHDNAYWTTRKRKGLHARVISLRDVAGRIIFTVIK